MSTRAVRVAVLMASMWLTSIGAGCNFFEPAKPEPPSGGTVIELHYETPDATLETLARAIEAKGLGNGPGAYTGGLADSTPTPTTPTPNFRQFFWTEEQLRWEQTSGRPAPSWDFLAEQTFYSRFIQLRGEKYLMDWGPDETAEADDIDDIAGRALIHRHYLVRAQSEDGGTETIIAIGYADLAYFRDNAGNWRIARWWDRPDPLADPRDTEQQTLGLRRLQSLSIQ